MPLLRIFHDVYTKSEISRIEENIKIKNENFAEFDEEKKILKPGFRKSKQIFKPTSKGYYLTEYFEIDKRSMPSYYTEMYYFKNLTEKIESEEKFYPILIKILFNRKKKVLCLYSKQILRNDLVNNLVIKLRNKHGLDFKTQPQNYIFKEDELDDLVDALDIKDYTAISVWDKDNRAILENPQKITETEKFISFLNDTYKGKWHYLKVPFDELNIELKINNKTQKYITFINDFVDDMHLTNAVDFLVSKIFEVEDFSGSKQVFINSF
ncbi:MAG: hypothetical protein CEE43_01805 [Promethearchaeota archaeon Loki_b32]|nr:MAG: hypothetical protein CEE43_01805 [Candidatus Lokiarchaeota archaeon Loki_b32]